MFKSAFLLLNFTVFGLFGVVSTVHADGMRGRDDPTLSMLIIDQLEIRDVNGNNPWVLEGQAWIGKDLQKLWFKAELEHVDNETEDAELQALYSQAIAPFWDVQIGVRQNLQPTSSRSWAVFGLQGLAPYFFEVDAALFIGESGRTSLRLEAEYELLLTQRLILTPEIEANFYGQNETKISVGSGLSDVEFGVRLRYEIRREFAPYIGINLNKSFGKTADFEGELGQDTKDLQWVVGIRAWF